MEKYDLVPQQLLYEGTILQSYLFHPEPMDEEVVLLVHDKSYLEDLKMGNVTPRMMREIGFPYSPQLVQRELCIMYGTVQAALSAMEDGVAFNMAGGTHHAYADKGEGFCLLNDIAIGAAYLLNRNLVKKILIVDLDVHQGNGTARIFKGNEDVFTFSMHGMNNYPHRKEKSHLDIALRDGTGDDEYLSILRDTLLELLNYEKPDFIFYQSGVDILATDKLGKLSITRNGCLERDQLVLSFAKEKGIPLTAAMGGGYSEKITDIIEAHCNLYRQAAIMYS